MAKDNKHSPSRSAHFLSLPILFFLSASVLASSLDDQSAAALKKLSKQRAGGAPFAIQEIEILDAVDKGIVEGGYAWTHYWSGKNSAAAIFSNPAAGAGTGMDQLSHLAWLFQGGG